MVDSLGIHRRGGNREREEDMEILVQFLQSVNIEGILFWILVAFAIAAVGGIFDGKRRRF